MTLLDAVDPSAGCRRSVLRRWRYRVPDTVVSGRGAVDAGGAQIPFATGTFRFPVIAPGTYRLRVAPPQTHIFPSAAADAALQALPGAPFALSAASRGQTFSIAAGQPLQADVPVDPTQVDVFVTQAGEQGCRRRR